MDPRVKTPALGLSQQFTLSKQLYDGMLSVQKALDDVRALRERINRQRGHAGDERALVAFQNKVIAIQGEAAGGRGGGGRGGAPEGPDTLSNISGGLSQLLGLLQGADITPTTQLVAAVGARRQALAKLMTQWSAITREASAMKLEP